jgi:uncharacterized protein (DUF488 family)
MKLFTIGFAQKSARQFFDLLKKNQVECLVDIRLHPSGQLAGFAKGEDLKYFLKELIDCDYRRIELLAPSEEIFKAYRADKNWLKYAAGYQAVLDSRNIPDALDRSFFEGRNCCLLCSEASPEKCHRRLVAERLAAASPNVSVIHL